MYDHRVQGILHFVCDPRRYAPEIRELLGQVPLRFELLERLIVAHADQGADRLAGVFDILNGCQKLPGSWRAGNVQRRASYRAALAERAFYGHDERMIPSERLVDRKPG